MTSHIFSDLPRQPSLADSDGQLSFHRSTCRDAQHAGSQATWTAPRASRQTASQGNRGRAPQQKWLESFLKIRKPLLYPAELRGHSTFSILCRVSANKVEVEGATGGAILRHAGAAHSYSSVVFFRSERIRTKMGRLEKGSPSYPWHFVDSM